MKKITDHETMKLNNQLTILRRIRDSGPVTRVELQEKTSLSWGTITSSIKELLGRRIITEIGSVTTGVGRRPVELDMNTGKNFVLGLHLGSFLLHSSLMDVKGKVVGELDVPVRADSPSAEILAALLRTARSILEKNSVDVQSLGGIGIAAPGAVDFRTGTCLYAPRHPHWKNVPLKEKFEEALGVPCFVDHVSNCFALSEKLFGYGKGLDNFVCVLLGTGVSAGIVIGGEVYRGADCFSGEFGHTCIDMDGPECACGNRGCLEAFVSGPALVRMAGEEVPRLALSGNGAPSSRKRPAGTITAETVLEAARSGDPAARGIFNRMGVYLGIGVSNLINLVNPQRIIIGGWMSKASDQFLPSFTETVARRAWHASTKEVSVSPLERGAVMGAAALVLQELFSTGEILRRGRQHVSRATRR